MQAVVLAGGAGTRLGARTLTVPKYLVEVAGRPFAHWQLERLQASGFDEVVLCIGRFGDAIRAAIGDEAFGLAVRYSDDGPIPLGTAGALRRARSLLAESFVVTYGDSYLPFDYAAILADLRAHAEAQATLAVYQNRGRFDVSNVRLQGELVVEYKKGHGGDFEHIDYGAMALRRGALDSDASDLADLQAGLAARGVMRAFVAEERFYEIGSEQGLADLELALSRRRPA